MPDPLVPGSSSTQPRSRSLRAAAHTWFLAIRPATLPASTSGVVVGVGAALGSGSPFRADTAIACLAVALLLQVCANLANDLSDFRRGADTTDRLGPTRVAATGLVSERQLETAIGLTLAAAAVVGGWLALVGGPVLVGFGIAAAVAALAYTGGPLPYGYRGLGEVFVFAFFGLVAVVGTAYLQSGHFEPLYVAAAVPIGALTTAILVVNNLRDVSTDRAARKRTLAVMLGETFARAEYVACFLAAGVVPIGLVAAGLWRAGVDVGPLTLAPLATLPFALRLIGTVLDHGDPRRLNKTLRGTARLTLLFAVLFAGGMAAGRWPSP